MAEAVPDKSSDAARYHPCKSGAACQICKDEFWTSNGNIAAEPAYASLTPVCRPGVSGPNSVHRIVAQISGSIPNPKNTGVYE